MSPTSSNKSIDQLKEFLKREFDSQPDIKLTNLGVGECGVEGHLDVSRLLFNLYNIQIEATDEDNVNRLAVAGVMLGMAMKSQPGLTIVHNDQGQIFLDGILNINNLAESMIEDLVDTAYV